MSRLIRQQQSSTILSLKDPQSGQINRLHLESGRRGEYPPTYFHKILLAERVDKKGMRDNAIRAGLGGTVVGVHHSSAVGIPPARLEPLKGIRATVTVILDFDRLGSGHLRLLDPTKVDEVSVDKRRYTLAGDYTAAEASYGRINEIWIGFMNMIRGEHMRGAAGLLLLQPYDSEKIPVIFVHGLFSSPYAWRNVANSLSVDPEIRRRYQFWVFSYSTGNPIAYSALLLREDLPSRHGAIRTHRPDRSRCNESSQGRRGNKAPAPSAAWGRQIEKCSKERPAKLHRSTTSLTPA
jgi:hypothetical protein